MPPKEFSPSRTEMEILLQEETIGYLGLSLDGGPYVVPLNYAYIEGKILFHCALGGKKLDYLQANPQVCFTVGRQSGQIRRHGDGDPCHPDNTSVICYGTARVIADLDERRELLDTFNHCFEPEAAAITLQAAAKCCAVEISIREMTGRQEKDRQCTYWKYSFNP
ncbi:MAG: pyridoxamine 5'-phosphate oxidase family protein [Anaerolineales bacterium]|nr:pyridoxamine 5'-phosphate oxidase family protein [Anaerolineales bacterium]